VSWLYLYLQMQPMADISDMAMPSAFAPWNWADLALNLVIWWAMMPGMMLPSATPMILTFATINWRKRESGQVFIPTTVFTTGYLIAWVLFGILATLADWGRERAAMLAPATQSLTPIAGATVVIAAGIASTSRSLIGGSSGRPG